MPGMGAHVKRPRGGESQKCLDKRVWKLVEPEDSKKLVAGRLQFNSISTRF